MNTIAGIQRTKVEEASKLEQLENAILSCRDRIDNLVNKARYTQSELIGRQPYCPTDCEPTDGLPLIPKLTALIRRMEDSVSEVQDILHEFRHRTEE